MSLKHVIIPAILSLLAIEAYAGTEYDSFSAPDTIFFEDGSWYYGEIRDSLFNGQGVMSYADSTVTKVPGKTGCGTVTESCTILTVTATQVSSSSMNSAATALTSILTETDTRVIGNTGCSMGPEQCIMLMAVHSQATGRQTVKTVRAYCMTAQPEP